MKFNHFANIFSKRNNGRNNEFICLDKNPYYKVSEEDKTGFVSLNFPASDNCEIYFKAKKNTSVIHLRFLDLFLSAGDAIVVYDPYTNDTLQSYHGDEKLLISVTLESDSARVVFVRGSSQDAARIRFEIVHRALPQGKDCEIAAWQVTECLRRYVASQLIGCKYMFRSLL